MKRFTATEKWNKPWFRKLPPKLKLFWNWVCDNTDCAGVWVVDLELASIYIGEQYTEIEILRAFGDRIHPFDKGSKWWLTGFIDFQYGDLSEKCKPHAAVIAQLKRHGLYTLYKRLVKGLETLQEKEKEKEKEKNGGGTGEPEADPNVYEQRDPTIEAPNVDQFAKGFEIATKLVRNLNELTGSKFSEAGDHMNIVANRVCEVHFDYAGLKLMQERKSAEWKGTKYAVGLTPRKLYGDEFHTYYGQREVPLSANNANGTASVSDLRTVIQAKEKRAEEVKRKNFSPGGLRGGVYHEPQWTDAGAKDLHDLLRREIKDLQRQLSAAL